MTNQIENNLLSKLEAFKEFIQKDLTDGCKHRYGAHTFSKHMKPYLDDMLENFEAKIETIAERALLEDELSYDENYKGE